MPKFLKFFKKKKAKSSSGGGYKPVEVVVEKNQSPIMSDPIDHRPELKSQCRLKIHCSKSELSSLNVGYFKLGKTECEMNPYNNWDRREVDSFDSILTTKCKVKEGKKLYRSLFDSSLHDEQFLIETSSLNDDRIQAEFVPVKLAVKAYKNKLAWPTKGYFYHFIDGELYNEYKVVGEGKWSLQVTFSRGSHLSDELVSQQHITSVLLPYKVESKIYCVQHFVYRKCKMTQESLNEIDVKWLKEHAFEVPIQDVIDIRNPFNSIEPPEFKNVVLLGNVSGEHTTREATAEAVNIYKDNSVSGKVPVFSVASLGKGKRRVPRKIHFFWQGGFDNLRKHAPNIELTAKRNPSYKVILHVLPNEGEEIDVFKASLCNEYVNVQDVRNEPWYISFKGMPRFKQFDASRTGERRHFASGADIIKSELLAAEGGIWNDVDNPPIAPLPEQFFVDEGDILTAGPVIFKRWGNVKGVHSSTLATHRNNRVLRTINENSFNKYKAKERIIYQECKETDSPDKHFKMISETAGSLHLSRELFALSCGFETEVDRLLESGKKYNMERVVMDKYFEPTATTGAGELDDVQAISLVEMLSAPGHVVI
ncbi:hypothetical protein [Vibrio owensii]|uniref:hypothetical protein n=1 Tax=Vibrio owensii TaxID=696485 RepID=UPI002893F220|nr:hypothetical protein THZB04_70184 [Vibrio owensii]